MVGVVGLEPTISCSQSTCVANYATPRCPHRTAPYRPCRAGDEIRGTRTPRSRVPSGSPSGCGPRSCPSPRCRAHCPGRSRASVRRLRITQVTRSSSASRSALISHDVSRNPLLAIRARVSAGDSRQLNDGSAAQGTGEWIGWLGPARMSKNANRPPGRTTRATSRYSPSSSAMFINACCVHTMSKLASSNGMSSALTCTNETRSVRRVDHVSVSPTASLGCEVHDRHVAANALRKLASVASDPAPDVQDAGRRPGRGPWLRRLRRRPGPACPRGGGRGSCRPARAGRQSRSRVCCRSGGSSSRSHP